MTANKGSNPPVYSSDSEKVTTLDKNGAVSPALEDLEARASLSSSRVDQTHRKLKSRHIQLIGIGGTIGTVLYVR
jgi:amino acid transporter